MKQTLDVEGLPEGWKAVAYRPPKNKETYLTPDGVLVEADHDYMLSHLIAEKIQPRRIVLEDTGELRQPQEGEYVENNGNYCLCRKPERWGNEHKIWKQVKEE